MTQPIPPVRRASFSQHVISSLTPPHLPAPQGQWLWVRQLEAAFADLDNLPALQHLYLPAGGHCLEQYLSARPEAYERVLGYLNSGQLVLPPHQYPPCFFAAEGAPWLCEILIRNLLIGVGVGQILGAFKPSNPPIAFFAESSGQLPAFVPQVLGGFNIRLALLPHQANTACEQHWQGDDSSIIAVGRVLSGQDQPSLRALAAPYTDFGQLFILRPYGGLAPLQTDLQAATRQPNYLDEVLQSSPAAYAGLLGHYARLKTLPNLSGAIDQPNMKSELSEGAQAKIIAAARLLLQVLEPASVLHSYGQPTDDLGFVLPANAQTLFRGYWQWLLAYGAFGDSEAVPAQNLESLLRLDANGLNLLGQVVVCQSQEDGNDFCLTTAKLPEQSEGLLVRGFNRGASPQWVRLTPFRAFAKAEVVTLNEETVGPLALAEDGSVLVRAVPQRLISLRFSD
jgi:hypothetical protein